MKTLFVVVVFPCLAAITACGAIDDREVAPDRSVHFDEPHGDNLAPKYGRGEGERELGRGVLDSAGDRTVADATVMQDYRTMIAEDEDLAFAAGNTRLFLEDNHLVLRGTVATSGLSDALGELAKAIAEGGEVDNQLAVSDQ